VALIEGIPGEFGPQPWGEAILRSCELLLLRITRRPANHEVRLPGLATTPRHVVEDRTGKALTWRRAGDDLRAVRAPRTGCEHRLTVRLDAGRRSASIAHLLR
jgi:hypothetical protein